MDDRGKMIKLIEATTVQISTNNKWGDDIPEDIMRIIMKKLFFVDQARFLAVCKRWQQKDMGPFPSPAKQLPWQFNVNFQCNDVGSPTWYFTLYDPICKKTFPSHDTSLSLYLSSHLFPLPKPRIWASKDGWLLLSFGGYENVFELLFYNPFTKEQIILPILLCDPLIRLATCSSSPTSSDCIVFVAHKIICTETICISACHPSDGTWEQTTFSCYLSISVIVYFEGLLYLSDERTQMVVLDFSSNTCTLHDFSDKFSDLPINAGHMRMIESGGDLFLVYFALSKSQNVRFFKLVDELWIRVESLGNQALLVGNNYSISVEASEKGIEVDEVFFVEDDSVDHLYYNKGHRVHEPSKSYAPFNKEGKHKLEFLLSAYVEPVSLP